MSPRDWTGLLRPGVSHKREDPSTVGRFGLGFTSVYHLTGEQDWRPQLELNWGYGLGWRQWSKGAGEYWRGTEVVQNGELYLK